MQSRNHRLVRSIAKCCLVAAVAGISMTAQAQAPGIDPEAQRLLKTSTDFLARQEKFAFDARVALEVVLHSGQKIEFNHAVRQTVQRPNTAPNTIEGMLDFARESLGIVAPAGDVLYKDAYSILMDGVTAGMVVGKSVIEGAPCDQLAFRAPTTDLQVWVQSGAQPLLRKIVITTRDVVNAPQFSATVTRWDLQPRVNDQTFRFSVPSGATKVGFMPQ